jgi:quercetin dioxygenase-like cupin family protein
MRSIPVRWRLFGAVLIAIVVCGGTGLVGAVRAGGAGHDHTVFSAQLPNVPGKTLTAIVVEYGPGGSSPAHRHGGSVFAYVLSGQIRSENSATGPVRVYRAGETFFEPPGSTHLVSANASDTEPASALIGLDGSRPALLSAPDLSASHAGDTHDCDHES